jgi:hypothetical protein
MNADKIKKLIPRSLWTHGDNQHRVVLFVQNKKVYYAVRGGNVLNPFDHGEKPTIETFLENSEHIGEVTEAEWDQVQNDIESCIETNKNLISKRRIDLV